MPKRTWRRRNPYAGRACDAGRRSPAQRRYFAASCGSAVTARRYGRTPWIAVVGEYSWCARRYSLTTGRRRSAARTWSTRCAVAIADGGSGIVVSATQPTTPTAATVAATAHATAAGVGRAREGASTVGSAASRAAKRFEIPQVGAPAPRRQSPVLTALRRVLGLLGAPTRPVLVEFSPFVGDEGGGGRPPPPYRDQIILGDIAGDAVQRGVNLSFTAKARQARGKPRV